MDYDKLLEWSAEKIQVDKEPNMSWEEYAEVIKANAKVQTQLNKQITEYETISSGDVKWMFNGYFDIFKQQDDSKYDAIKNPIQYYSRKEVKQRTQTHLLAKEGYLKAVEQGAIRNTIIAEMTKGKALDRGVRALLAGGAKDENELIQNIQLLQHRNDSPEAQKAFNQAMKTSLDRCKDFLKNFATAKDTDSMLKMAIESPCIFTALVELQPGSLSFCNRVQKLDLDEAIVDDWEKNYAPVAVDAGSYRIFMSTAANPLYKTMDPVDAYYADFVLDETNGIDYDDRKKLIQDEELNEHNQFISIKNNKFNGFPGYVKIASFTTSKRLGEVMDNPGMADTVKTNMKRHIRFNAYLSGSKDPIESYKFKGADQTELSFDEACDKIYNGEAVHMFDKNGKYFMQLEMDPLGIGRLKAPKSHVLFNIRDKVSSRKEKFSSLIEKSELADIEKNTLKVQKDQAVNDVQKEINKQMNVLYKAVTSEVHWYHKGDKKFTDLESKLKKFVKNPKAPLNEQLKAIQEIRENAQEYLGDKFNNGLKTSKHAIKRRDAALAVLQSFNGIEETFKNCKDELDVFNKKLGIEEPWDALQKEETVQLEISNQELENNKEKVEDLEEQLLIPFKKEEEKEDSIDEIAIE